jgi:hypothetical protein
VRLRKIEEGGYMTTGCSDPNAIAKYVGLGLSVGVIG